MAAGEFTVQADTWEDACGTRSVYGIVTLDGLTETPVDLSGYLSIVEGGTVTMDSSAVIGIDLLSVTTKGSTLEIRPWGSSSSTVTTLIASTNNTNMAYFKAWGNA